jgi:hypothetical protein
MWESLEGTGMRIQGLVSFSISLAAAAACVALVVPQAAAKGRRLGDPVVALHAQRQGSLQIGWQ